MNLVQIQAQYQITLPNVIRQKMGLKEGDTLKATEKDGQIILELARHETSPKSTSAKPSLRSLSGANKDSGLYDSIESSQYIQGLRTEWK